MNASIPEPQAFQPPTGSAHKPKPRTKTRAAKSVNKAPKPNKGAKARQPARPGAHPGSKTAKILHWLERSGGATLKDLMKATDWQAHSVRGFLSGLRKKRGLTVTLTQGEDGVRRYALKA